MSDFSEREYEIMGFINTQGSCMYLDVVNHFDPATRCNETKQFLRHMADQKMLTAYPSSASLIDCRVSLSPEGFSILTLHREQLSSQHHRAQQAAQKDAEEKRQKSFDRKVSIANVLVPLITFLLGLLAGHLSHLPAFFH